MHSRLLVIGTNGFVGKHVRLILEKEGIEYFEIEGKNQVNLLNQEEIAVSYTHLTLPTKRIV